jgi:hypothetical protein
VEYFPHKTKLLLRKRGVNVGEHVLYHPTPSAPRSPSMRVVRVIVRTASPARKNSIVMAGVTFGEFSYALPGSVDGVVY